MMRLIFWTIPVFLFSQETEIIKKTLIYTAPHASRKSALGQLYPGTTINKLKKDKSGQFIKASLEFYIPVEFLEEGRVSHPPGIVQIADDAHYKLLQAKKEGNQVRLFLQVTNKNTTKNLDFSPMALIKIIGKGENKGDLNPFEGKHQALAIIKPQETITAELIYDFKSKPKRVELICTGKLSGDRVFYNLGF